MCAGGIQHSGSRPSASSVRRCRESVLSVLACRLRPRAAAVSAGSARCAATPAAAEPGQPGAQVRAVGRGDLAAPDLPGDSVEVVEGDLLPVDIQPAYDWHRDLLKLQGAHSAHTRMTTNPIVTASELRRFLLHTSTSSATHADLPMHVI